MPFKYEKELITLGNYTQVFSDCSPDVQDEIRNAVLDDTPIGKYIQLCKEDGYKLNQVRLCLREYVQKSYINTAMTAKTLYAVRQLYKSKRDMDFITRYLTGSNLIRIEAEALEKIVYTVLAGGDVSKIDFTYLPKVNVDIVCEGLLLNYPMWLLVGSRQSYTPQTLRLLMRAMSLGINIHPFLQGKWGNEQIAMIIQSSNGLDTSVLFDNINHKFSTEQINTVTQLLQDKHDISFMCSKDKDGEPEFNKYQMWAMMRYYHSGFNPAEHVTPKMTDTEICEVHDYLLADKQRLSGTLGKKSNIN